MEKNTFAVPHKIFPPGMVFAAAFLLLTFTLARAEIQVLHTFNLGPQYPQSQLVQAADGNFYGVTPQGGPAGGGTLFQANPAGGVTVMASFTGANAPNPFGALVLVGGNTFYGTTQSGGTQNDGTVFSYVIGGALTTLYSFDGTHGATPQGGLTLGNDGALYGTTRNGGTNGYGAIFRITTGGAFTPLFSFGFTNANPATALCLAPDGNFYGGTAYGPALGTGSAYSYGTLFRVTTAGVFSQLVALTNSLGYAPAKSFALGADGAIYGTMSAGGLNGNGAAFRLTTGGNYTVLASFSGFNPGATPLGGLTFGADATTNFYGTCQGGGGNAEGSIFRLAVNPNAYTNSTLTQLASFNSTLNGSQPTAGTTVGQDGKLYGVTYYGVSGAWGCFYSTPAGGGAITLLGLFNNGGGLLPKAPPVPGGDGNFYGTTYSGGPGDNGTIYRITTNGTFTQLATLGGTNGANPIAPLCIGADGALYGTTYSGSPGNAGTVFRVTTNGDFRTLLYFLNNTSGGYPAGGMALGPDGLLYGTTTSGGTNNGSGVGTVFRLMPSGTNFILTNLVVFTGGNGASPEGTLLNGGDGFLYGTTFGGGSNNNGTVFRLGTNGAFNTVAYMMATNGSQSYGGLVRGADGALYGGSYGNFSNARQIYRCTTNGGLTSFLTLPANLGTEQFGTLVAGPNGYLYDTVFDGGAVNGGVLFRLATNGTPAVLSSFTTATGIQPFSVPAFGPDGNLYGTTSTGGSGGGGTIYRFSFDRITSIARNGTNVSVTATGTTGGSYALYATTNLASGIWTNLVVLAATNSLASFVDTNAWRFSQRFYRTAAQ